MTTPLLSAMRQVAGPHREEEMSGEKKMRERERERGGKGSSTPSQLSLTYMDTRRQQQVLVSGLRGCAAPFLCQTN